MVLILRNTWGTINKVLTLINAVLLRVVIGNAGLYNPKKEGYIKIPAVANIVLLLCLIVVVYAAIYAQV